MKKLGTVICMSTALMASSAANAAWEWNWLVGASAGYADRSGDLSMGMTDSAAAAVPFGVTEVVKTHNDSGFVWGLLGGLQAHCNGWVFGGELNVDWRDIDDTRNFAFTSASANANSTSARFDRGAVVGLSGRAGYEFLPYFMPYVRLGVETSKDELTVAGTDATPLTYGATNSKRNYRLVAGLGAEIPIPSVHGLSLRMEYNYISKGNNSITMSSTGSDAATLVTARMNPRTNMGKASLIYNFL